MLEVKPKYLKTGISENKEVVLQIKFYLFSSLDNIFSFSIYVRAVYVYHN